MPKYSSVTRGRTDRFTIRVWRTENALGGGGGKDVHAALGTVFEALTPLEVFPALEKLPRIYRIEVLDDKGNGPILDL